MATSDDRLAGFIKGLLTGSVDIGVTLIPLIGAYKAAKTDPEWKEKGIAEWLQSDPKAAEMLERVFKRVQETLPDETRAGLILALGGVPT
jgi:hypothetical protein